MVKNNSYKQLFATIILFSMVSSMAFISQSDFSVEDNRVDEVISDEDNSNISQEPETDTTIANLDQISPVSAQSASTWWDESFESRIELTITEPDVRDRVFEPIDIFMEFENNTCFINSSRIIYFDGSEQLEIPSQLWNVTNWKNGTGGSDYSDFIQSATYTFSVSIDRNEQNTYYIYFSASEMSNPEAGYYSTTQMSSTLSGGKAIVDTDALYIEFAEDSAFEVLKFADAQEPSDTNYHNDKSMSPSSAVTIGGSSATYTQDGSGFIRDWLLLGSYDTGTWGWLSSGQTIIDYNTFYVEGDIVSGKTWTPQHDSDYTIDLNTIYAGDEVETCVAWAMAYIYFPVQVPDAYALLGSDDGIRLVVDGELKHNNPVLRGIGTDQDHVSLGLVDEGWHSFAVAVEENGGGWSFRFRLSAGYNYSTIDNLQISLVPQINIETIDLVEEGPIFSQYRIRWESSGDMETWDILTFYRGLERYKSERTFWWGNEKNSTNSKWTVFNTNYPSALTTGLDEFIFDGYENSLSQDGFSAYDYISLWDSNGGSYYLAQGVFIEELKKGNELISFSSLEMSADYSTNGIKIVPGVDSDIDTLSDRSGPYPTEASYNVSVIFWEYLDNYVGIGRQTAVEEMNAISEGLTNTLTWENRSVEDLFFNLDVQLYDIDGIGAADVNVTLFNTTANFSGLIYPSIVTLKSNSTGGIDFAGLKGANYSCLVSYQVFNKPTVNLTWVNVTLDTTKSIEITDIELTRIELNLVRFDSTEPVVGANVSLYWNNTNSGMDAYGGYIGYQTSDATGTVSFYYLNSTQAEGNYTLKVFFYGGFRKINVTTELPQDIDEMVNFTVASSTTKTVWVQLEAFSSDLTHSSGSLVNTHYWGEQLSATFQFNWEYGLDSGPIQSATLIYELSSVSEGLLKSGSLTEGAGGSYSLTFNSADPSFGLDTLTVFILKVTATKTGFTPNTETILINLNEIQTDFSSPVSNYETYWNENLSLSVYLEDIDNNAPLTAAEVQYQVAQSGSVFGNMTSNGTAGWYEAEINSTDFVYAGAYTFYFTAEKEHYESQSLEIPVVINKIRTLLNDKIFVPQAISINVTSHRNFTFEYTEATTGLGISGAVVANYEWSSDSLDLEGNGTLIDEGNGVYTLDFDMANRPVGEYSLVVQIGQTNYVERTSVISLSVVNKPIEISLGGDIVGNVIEKPQGGSVVLEFALLDLVETTLQGSDVFISGAEVTLVYDGKTLPIIEENNIYRIVVDVSTYQSLTENIYLPMTISITKANFTADPITIPVYLTPPEFEILGGIPRIYVYIGLVVGAIAIVMYGTSRYVKYAKIPLVIKKIMETRKQISGKKEISPDRITVSVEEELVETIGERWAILGLNLGNILGLNKKPNKENLAPGDDALGGEF